MKTLTTIRPILAASLCAAGLNLNTLANELDKVTTGSTTPATPAAAAPVNAAPAPVATSAAPASTSKATVASSSTGDVTPDYLPFSLSPEVGTTGAGGTAAWRFSNHFGLAAGGDYFSHTLFNNRTISGVSYSGDFTLQSENVGLRYYPSKTSSFYLYVGALFNQNEFNGSASGTITIDGQDYNNAQLNAQYKQQPVCPEAAIGGNFFYFDKGHHCALGGELGVFYLGNPKLTLNSPNNTIPTSALASYQSQAESDLKKIPVWPVLKLQVTISF